jgi:hypothetical protein
MDFSLFWYLGLFIIGLLAALILYGRARASKQFSDEVVRLFSSADVSHKKFDYEQLVGLPGPVARYFRHVLKEGHLYISSARLTHNGLFKTNLKKNWVAIEGEQYFTASPPGFIWKGKTAFFTARDMYIHNKGRLVVLLLSLVKIIDAHDEVYDEAELQRWLAECVWFPTNLLPGNHVAWESIDSHNAKLIFSYKTLSLSFLVTFSEIGEIVKFETMRFMGKEKREKWIGTLWDYQEHNGIISPRTIEVKWVIDNQHYPYARFHVKTIEYNTPSRF